MEHANGQNSSQDRPPRSAPADVVQVVTADEGFFETFRQALAPLGASLRLAHPDEVEEGLGDTQGVLIVDATQTFDLEKRLAELRQAASGPVPTLAVVSPEFEPLLALPGLGSASLDFERTPLHAPSLRARVRVDRCSIWSRPRCARPRRKLCSRSSRWASTGSAR